MRQSALFPAFLVCLLTGSQAWGATVTVIMTNFAFVPKILNIQQGDTITWVNKDNAGHDAVSGTNKIPSGLWASPLLANGATYSFTFNGVAAGNYRYYCTPHVFSPNWMTGLVVVAQGNLAPTVTITSPTNNAVFTAPATFTLQATAIDSDGSVAQVEFFNGATSLGVDFSNPYSAVLNSLAAGSYTLAAVATDNRGATTTSASISITVATGTVSAVTILNPICTSGSFSLSFATEAGAHYAVQRTDSLNPVNWHSFTNLVGTGTTITVTDAPLPTQRFYRVEATP